MLSVLMLISKMINYSNDNYIIYFYVLVQQQQGQIQRQYRNIRKYTNTSNKRNHTEER